jgi:hypothetical protein
MLTFEATTTFQVVTCCKCHIHFCMDRSFYEARLRDHESFFCPAGHEQYFTGRSDLDVARDNLAAEKHRHEQAQARADRLARDLAEQQRETAAVARRLQATRGVVTRQRNKISAGRCPCCSATFKNLRAHMRIEHPKWNPEREAEAMNNGTS